MCVESFPLKIFNKLHKNAGTHTERGMMEFMPLVCLQNVQNYFNQIYTWHFNFSLSVKSVFRKKYVSMHQSSERAHKTHFNNWNILTRYCQHNSNIL